MNKIGDGVYVSDNGVVHVDPKILLKKKSVQNQLDAAQRVVRKSKRSKP